MTPNEAAARLRERQAAATQPDQMAATISELQAIVAQQAQRIEAMTNEIASLKKQLAIAQANAIVPENVAQARKAVSSTFTSRAKQTLAMPNVHIGDRDAYLANAIKTDKAIDAYAAAHNLPAVMIAAMHEGVPKVGMPEDALSLFLDPAVTRVTSESMTGKVISSGPYTLTTVGGYVAEVDTPTPTSNVYIQSGGQGINQAIGQ